MKRVIKSADSIDVTPEGLSIHDDGFLFQFIYDWYKTWEEFPTYEEVLDEYDDRVSRKVYKDAVDRISNGLAYISFYRYDGVEYIQLLDDPVLSWIQISDTVSDHFDEETVREVYFDQVEQAREKFLAKTDTEIYLLGRGGRHVCVDDTIGNIVSGRWLHSVALKLEKEIIQYMNNLTGEDLLELHYQESTVESATDVTSNEKLYVVHSGWDDGGPEDGPHWVEQIDYIYAESEEQACERYAKNCKDEYGEYPEGCWAEEATEEQKNKYEFWTKDHEEEIQDYIRSKVAEVVAEEGYDISEEEQADIINTMINPQLKSRLAYDDIPDWLASGKNPDPSEFPWDTYDDFRDGYPDQDIEDLIYDYVREHE